MDQEQKYELIEKYLEGSLTKAEQTNFDQLNQEDPSFQEEIRLHRKLGTTLQGEDIHDFRAALKEVDNQWQAPGQGRVRSLPIRRLLSLAATVLVLIAAAWWFFATKNTPSSEDLFAAQFEPYTMVLNQRSETTDTPQDVLLQQAITAYNQGQFAAAVSQFEELQSIATDNQTYSFYLAVSELAQGNTSKAIPVLEELANTTNLLTEQSRWYLALAYLKAEEMEKARAVLEGIQSGSFKYKEAQEMREEIKE